MNTYANGYALSVDGSDPKLPGFDGIDTAAARAILLATRGQTSIIHMVDTVDGVSEFTALAEIRPVQS